LYKLKRNILFVFLLFCSNIFGQNINYLDNITTKNGLPSNYIFCTEIDVKGFVWAGTDKGICKYNGATWQTWDVDNGLPGNYITKIMPCNSGGLWITVSEKGLYFVNEDVSVIIMAFDNSSQYSATEYDKAGNINCIKLLKDSMQERIVVKIKDNKITLDKIIEKVKKSENNNDNSSYLSQYFINNEMIKKYGTQGQLDTILWKTKNSLSKYYYVDTIDKHLYVGISGEGLFDITGTSYKLLNQKNGLINLVINDIRADKYKNITISTLGGGIYILQKNGKIVLENNELPIRQIQSVNGNIYYIDNGFFTKMDARNNKKKFALESEPLCFLVDKNVLYLGNFKGITTYNMANNKFVKKDNYPITAGISSIIKKDNQIYFSTYGSGIFALQNFKNSNIEKNNAPFVNIEKMISLKGGFLALSHESGFYICDSNQIGFTHYSKKNGLINNYCTSALQLGDTILIGCKDGLSVFKNSKIVFSINKKNGFIGKVVKEIMVMADGNVIVVSDKAIHLWKDKKLVPISNNILRLMDNEMINTATFEVISNSILLATSNRFLSLPYESNFDNQKIIAPSLYTVMLGDELVKDVFHFDVAFENKLIKFAVLPFQASLINAVTSYYKLNDMEWIPINKDGIFELKQYRPDDYKLYLKSINADGVESDAKFVARFTIQKPWWQKWWFLLGSILLLMIGIWQIAKFVNKQKRIKEQEQAQKLELERQRISRDLHDNMGAFTSALIANVQQLKSKIGDNAEMTKMQSNAEQILSSLRETIWVLKNKEIQLTDFSDGFKNYIFKVLQNFEEINFDTNEQIENNVKLPTTVAVHLNKIMQEAIQNIIKHANASVIKYTIESKASVMIMIEDNGIGFDTTINNAGNGLENMEWRANESELTLQISSVLNKGTKICITYIPSNKIP
jgi:signal transduction histidine kinase